MKTVYLIFMSLSVFILTSVLFVKQNTSLVFGNPADLSTVTVTVDKSLNPVEIDNLTQNIQNAAAQKIEKIKLISAEDQLRDVQTALPTYSRGLFEDNEIAQILNPIIEVQLNTLAGHQDIISKIKSLAGVVEVSLGNDWVEKMRGLFETLNIILNTVFILFFVILSFLIAILIRNYLIDSKDNISLLALLGAAPRQSFITQYLSIISRTLIAYALGVGFAAVMAVVIKHKLASNLQLSFISERINFLNPTNTLIILIGLVLNLGISYILSYRYVLKEYYRHD